MRNLLSARSLFSGLVLLCAISSAATATLLPKDEVDALEEIAYTLGKSDWDFNADPCSTGGGYETFDAVTCDCNFTDAHNNTVCHVISIVLRSQSLQGTLPRRLFKLPFLQNFDVTRNYLNGSIPKEWGSSNLRNISLLGNRLTGPIPKELGNISTLLELVVEINKLSGPLPPDLGNLPQLLALHLTSNNFTGELPQTFVKLTALQDLRLGDNQFTGKIPDFIQNLTNLTKLFIQGSGLQGPIPSGIALLEKLSDLRISDVDGPESRVPQLNCINMKILMLRSCNLTGELPGYLARMTKLTVLDLSFNKLSGEIPSSFSNLVDVDYIYLTGNQLTGAVPEWILEKEEFVDLSYNNFTAGGPKCQVRDVNLFASSAVDNATSYPATSGLVSCLKSQHCPENRYKLFINCGGSKVTIGLNTYTEDIEPPTASRFYLSADNWAYSSTGHFYDDELDADTNVLDYVSVATADDAQLYMTTRTSPLSLTYYGFCLINGNYDVKLHFAEIFFTSNESYTSLGRRAFNVYVQGKLVWEDFNIEIEAGGVGKPVIKTFTATVTEGTLEIRFYWAGKGTNAIPSRGVYGPLISAISVYPSTDFKTQELHSPPELANPLKSASLTEWVTSPPESASITVGAFVPSPQESANPPQSASTPDLASPPIPPQSASPPSPAESPSSPSPVESPSSPSPPSPVESPSSPSPVESPSSPSPPSPAESASVSTGKVVGIVAAIVFVVLLIFVIIWWRRCLGREDEMAQGSRGVFTLRHLYWGRDVPKHGADVKGQALQSGSFTLRQIKVATNNFNATNKIGEGGFGSVYKGLLSDGTAIAVKQLSSKSKQGNREFVTEIGTISALQHPNLVKLYGCCVEGNQLLLVYEYMENNSLARALFGPEEFQLKLDWRARQKICVGIARGLAYLHEESSLKIVHRDIKATNVLLDKDLNPKISDFGLAKLADEDNTHISTKIAGTYGYMAPEYAMRGYLTDKADIYSFGVVALEIVSGRSNISYQKKEERFCLLDWALALKERGNLIDLVDGRLGSDFDKEQVLAMIKVALLCTNATPTLRPLMSSVVSMLEGKVAARGLDSEGTIKTEEKIEAMRKHFKWDVDQAVRENMTNNMFTKWPGTGIAYVH